MTRKQIISEARSWLGTPYVHQGRLKGVGVDCVGLVEGLGQSFHLPYQDYLFYDRWGHGMETTLVAEFGKWMEKIPPHSAGPGDILTFWLRRPEQIVHCGILSSAPDDLYRTMIHTHARVGKVVEHSIDRFWSERIGSVFRLRGLEV